MYAQLGDIKFEGLKGFDSLGLKSEQIIAEHQLIEGKPRLQNAGSKADELAFNMHINSNFANPEKEYNALKDYQKNGNVLTMINGNGEMLGEYVIRTMELTINRTTAKGQWVDIDLQVTLIEDYHTDKQKQAELDAKNAGFANIEKLPPKTDNIIPITTDSSLVMADVNKVQADAKTAESLLDKAKKFEADANGYMDQASSKIQEVTSTLGNLQDKIENATTLGSSATNLLNQIGSISSSATDLQNSLNLHDLQNSLNLSSILNGELKLMMANAAPIANLTATLS